MLNIANRLKEAREIKGATQTQVSKETGINNKTLSGYERGVSEPDLTTLALLADYYLVSADYLLGRTDNIEENNNNDDKDNEITTIAAHNDNDEFTDEDLKDIEKFKEYVRVRNSK